MTAFRAVVLEHFRRPHNRGMLADPSVSVEGANPLCGDRIRIELRIGGDTIEAAGFTADACALCIASASVLTERARGMTLRDAAAIDSAWINEVLQGEPPAARIKCAVLPLDTLKRAIGEVRDLGA